MQWFLWRENDEGCLTNDDALKYNLLAIAVCGIHLFLFVEIWVIA